MAETVLVMPLLVLSLVLIVYLGWNFRRLAQVTNMDRYSVWAEVTPGTSGLSGGINDSFFGLNGDQALTLGSSRNNEAFMPKGHTELRDRQTDETYSYFDEFLEQNPGGLHQRYAATHQQRMNTDMLGLSELTRNGDGHGRMDGDWRYAREVYRDGSRWLYGTGPLDRRLTSSSGDPRVPIIDDDPNDGKPLSYYHVSPAISLSEVFFVELDEGLRPYESSGNRLAQNIREFYLAYPEYRGPDIANPAPHTGAIRIRADSSASGGGVLP